MIQSVGHPGENYLICKPRGERRFRTHGVREHLVDMGIEHDTLPVRRRHESIPVTQRLESVMDHDYEVTFLWTSIWITKNKNKNKPQRRLRGIHYLLRLTECFRNYRTSTDRVNVRNFEER